VANAKDVLLLGEGSWRQAIPQLSYGLDPMRSLGYRDIERPADLPETEVWDWAGAAGSWCGSYAFLE
jgi:hypothetical protein